MTTQPGPPEAGAEGEATYIVAVGASAGGLDALEKLFAGLPPDTGAAFVIVQHLSPDHKSMMASLLARHTAMPVVLVADDMPIRANHVYLIPPGALMHVEGQRLRLTPKAPHTFTLPIDVFFQSLATHHGDRAVGVILSGTGSDGTRGAGAINEAGGFLVAQEPQTAKFDGMPRSVISTGLVDSILPVELIPQRLVSHFINPSELPASQPARLPEDAAAPPTSALAGVMRMLLQNSGINFEDYKPSTVMRRIERRITVRQVGTLEAYLALLSQDRNELQVLQRELLIPVTRFFRDPDTFKALQRQVIEEIVATRQSGESIRVWCAGVSTGEEAYTVAMLFLEAFEKAKRWPNLKIFATDVNQSNIDKASAGVFPESIVAEVPQPYLDRFFVRRGADFAVRTELRQCIVFARHNMIVDPPFTKMDLVVCRNALIYFRPEVQDRVLQRLQYALARDGYLLLGSSEALGRFHSDFRTLTAKHKIWQVIRPATMPLALAGGVSADARPISLGVRRAASPSVPQAPGMVELGYQALVKAFAPPPAILVGASHEPVHFYGEVRHFLEFREGNAVLDVNRILLKPLVPVAAALLFRAARENTSVASDVLRLPASATDPDAAWRNVRLSVWPVGGSEEPRCFLLVFEEVAAGSPSNAPLQIDLASETSERLHVLEHELSATRESLQATIEELESANEELQSTNEELMASNEELQSSNEELQSVNEELNTLNAEYHEKIEILNRINADLESLSKVAASGTIFLDEHLHLTRFNQDAATIFRMRETDIGRPLSDLRHNLSYPDLMRDLGGTLSSGEPMEKSITAADGRMLLVKMLPYRVPSSSAHGVVVSFVDTTSAHKASRLQDVLDALADHIAVLDGTGCILMVNQAWRSFAHSNGDADLTRSGPGASYLDVCRVPQDEADAGYALRADEGLRAVLERRLPRFSMVYPCHSPEEERWFAMYVHPLAGELQGAVVSHINITSWWQPPAERKGGARDRRRPRHG